MSKKIKQMEMDALKSTFQDVRDLVAMNVTGLNSTTDNQMRLGLRKKKIRMQVVKNSLCRRVFNELGMKIDTAWTGPTTFAWGGNSLAELSREIEALAKKNPKIQVKSAVSEGQEVTFKQALAMPTKPEAIGRVLWLALSPASRIAAQLSAPVGRIAGQIKSIAEKPAEAAPASDAEKPAEAAPASDAEKPAEAAPASEQ